MLGDDSKSNFGGLAEILYKRTHMRNIGGLKNIIQHVQDILLLEKSI